MEKKDKGQTALSILDAVIRCKYAAESGNIRSIQVTEVAAEAGISTRTLNRYFPDKDEMLRAASLRFLELRYSEFAQMYRSLNTTTMNGRERLLFFLRTQKDYYKNDPVNAVLFVDANLECVRLSVAQDHWQFRFGEEIREIVISSLEIGIRDGSIRRDLDPAMTALLISANFNGLMQRLTFTFRSALSDTQKERVFQLFEEYQLMLEGYLRP